MSDISDLPKLDYSDPDYQSHPFRWLAKKAESHKIAQSSRGVELLDYDLCRNFLLDRNFGTDHANLVEKMGLPESRALEFKRHTLLTQNRGEARTRLRQTLSSLIGPNQAEAMRHEIRKTVSSLLDELPLNATDLKYNFADLVPAGVYCSWVNAPLSDARFVSDMSETVLSIFQRDPSLTPRIVAAYDKLFIYVKHQLSQRRANLGDDFLSALIRQKEAGDLSEEELEDFAVMLIEASADNTSHQIAIAVDRLTRLPDIWSALGENPSLVAGAIRETMRLWPRSISTSRTALVDSNINGVEIPKGTSLFASFGAAHRQLNIFNNPHEFDINRPAKPPHMNFGGGAFSCLGQFVATIEVEEAIAQLAHRFPKLQLTNVEHEFTPMFQSIKRLDAAY